MKMLINGEKVDSESGSTIPIYNPSTHELLDSVPSATQNDLEKALESAQLGKRLWGTTTVLKRVEILENISKQIEIEKVELATLLAKEAGKIYLQAMAEVEHAITLFREYAYRLRYHYGSILPADEDAIFVRHEPLGVVACIIPFNFPIELYAHKVAPALAAGNAVIIKPASDAPLSNIYISDLIIRCGVPAQAIQVITGSGSVIGAGLAGSKHIDAVSMTGSTEVGIDVYLSAAKNLSRCYLELGGNDPLLIFNGVDVDYAVEEAIKGRILHAGQACCSSKRFIVQKGIREAFTQRLLEKLSRLKIGDTFAPDTQVGPLINEKAACEVESYVQKTVDQGAVCALGGKRFERNYFEVTVLTGVTPEMDIAKDMEVFGPVFPVIEFDTEQQAIFIANNCRYGLSSGVICSDMKVALRVADSIDAGNVTINGSGLYRTHDMPFGGHRHSGLGTEGLYNTLEEFTKTKSVVFKAMHN